MNIKTIGLSVQEKVCLIKVGGKPEKPRKKKRPHLTAGALNGLPRFVPGINLLGD